MANKEPSELWALCKVAQANSERWFGDATASPEKDIASSISHMTLSLCSEAGNLAGIIKLIDRGEIDPLDARAHFEMVMKLTDVFTYVLNIAALLKCDLLRAYEQKVIENEHRFNSKPVIKPVLPVGWRTPE